MTTRWRKVLRWTLLLCAGCANSSSRPPATPLPASDPPPAATSSAPVSHPAPAAIRPVASKSPPAPMREFRGMWVASVKNMDWPSREGLTTEQQKVELLALLDRASALHLNAVVLQVRPFCDALYESKIEPWSEFLSGKMGVAPKPYYDPLAFAVAEAHRRGLELHAWFNPYRVRPRDDKTPAARNYVTATHPELIRAAGTYQMLDPSDPRSRGYSLGVIMDVVRRYDIDGVHLDDYFYPYPVKGVYKPSDFPDDGLWQRYLKTGGKLSRSDWRRENVNTFVRVVYASIKKEKPWVKFGISPFGIWRPGQPAGITAGLDSYEALFADSKSWLINGWVDYLSPQLYWPSEDKEHSFAVLLPWWAEQNPLRRHVWPGMRTDSWPGFSNDQGRELAKEIELTRRQPGATGDLLWHGAPIMQATNGVAQALARLYATPALVPASPWLGDRAPGLPSLTFTRSNSSVTASWKAAGSEPVWQWVLQKETGATWTTEVLPAHQITLTFHAAALPETIALTAVSRTGILSPPALVKIQ